MTDKLSMTEWVHRTLMFVAGVITSVGGLLAVSTPQGMDPNIGAWLALAGGVATIVANQWRIAWGRESSQ